MKNPENSAEFEKTYELPVCAWEFYGALYQAN